MTDASFRIERVLGSGGQGTVYRAVMRSPHGLERPVALKMLRGARADEAAVARLRDEARLLATVKHRAVVNLIDLVQLDSGWAVVMELAEGLDLHTILAYRQVPPRAAVQIVAEVAAALHAMWTAESDEGPLRLVHRDLKPANLVVTPNGEVLILDFGLATSRWVEKEARTATDMVVGTLKYMAPERFRGDIDGPSDIYALGVVLLDLLGADLAVSGFCAEDEFERRVAPALATAERVGGMELAELIARMIAYDPVVRPTALELSRACRRLAPRVAGPDLADWALDEVDELYEELTEPLTQDPLVGATVTTEAAREPEPGFPWVLGLGALVFAGVLSVSAFFAGGLMGGGVFWIGLRDPPRPELIDIARLVEVPTGARRASITADGRTVLYVAGGSIWRHAVGGAPQRVVVPHEPVSSALISPSGDRIAYRAGREIHLIEGASPPRPLAERGWLEAWHPDGQRLLITVPPDGDAMVGGAGTPRVLDVIAGTAEDLPGERLAGGRWVGATDAVVASAPDALRLLHGGRSEALGPAPDAFTVSSDGRSLIAADFDGVRSRLLSGPLRGELAVDTTLDATLTWLAPPAGDRVLFGQLRLDARVRRLDVEPARERVLTERLVPLPQNTVNAVLLPDGRLSVAVPQADLKPGRLKRAGSEQLSLRDADGRVLETLGTIVTRSARDAGVSADRRTAWLSMPGEGGRHELFQTALDRAEAPRRVARFDPMEVGSLVVDPAGERVGLTDVDGRVRIVPLADPLALDGPALATGWEVRAWTGDGALVGIDRDGSLAALRPGAEPLVIASDVLDVLWVGPQHALVLRDGGVWAVPLGGGRSWLLAAVDPDVDGVNASATPDLTTALVVEWRDGHETWVARYGPAGAR